MNIVFDRSPDIDQTQFKILCQNLQSRNQGWLNIEILEQQLAAIPDFAAKNLGTYTDIVVLGIGGSMLGPKMLRDVIGIKNDLIVHCLDNIDPWIISQLDAALPYATTLFLVQTKSGGTPETIAQYEFFRSKVEMHRLAIVDHFVFVTDPEVGHLRHVATAENITSFEIPQNIGGRFSVFTPIGLVVAALMGQNIEQYIQGAQIALQNQVQTAYYLALWQVSQSQKNVVCMPYSSRLSTFSQWYVQLLSESIGKRVDRNGAVVHAGLTPIPAIGATDQHSGLQLFAEGPDDKQFLFVTVGDHQAAPRIPALDTVDFKYLSEIAFETLLHAEFLGTRDSLTEAHRPIATLEIEKIDEKNLAQLCVFLELTIAFIGEILNINAFDQPGVERSKQLTREHLLKK